MAEPASRGRLTSLLWLLAGLMALTAAGIRYYRQEEISWPWAAAGLFCLALGIAAWKRAEVGSGPPTGRDRHPHA